MSAVTFHQKANVGHLVLRSPPTNFIGEGFNDDLRAAVHDAGESNSRALLITAEGPNFSLGGAPWEWSDKSSAWFRTFIAEVTASYRAIEALEFPVVAASEVKLQVAVWNWRCAQTSSSPRSTPSCGARRGWVDKSRWLADTNA